MDDTVIIEHEQWGRVDGVERLSSLAFAWKKNDVLYFSSYGWREAPKPKWVLHNADVGERTLYLCAELDEPAVRPFLLPKGYRWKTVEIEKEVEG